MKNAPKVFRKIYKLSEMVSGDRFYNNGVATKIIYEYESTETKKDSVKYHYINVEKPKMPLSKTDGDKRVVWLRNIFS